MEKPDFKSPFGVQVPVQKKSTDPVKKEADPLPQKYHSNFLTASTEVKKTNSPAPTSGSDPQIEAIKREIAALMEKNKVSPEDEAKYIALDIALEKKRNDAFELRQRERDANHEKLWGRHS